MHVHLGDLFEVSTNPIFEAAANGVSPFKIEISLISSKLFLGSTKNPFFKITLPDKLIPSNGSQSLLSRTDANTFF